MTDDEEKQVKQELLALDLSLRRKQEFWETPRNLAILVGVTAAIAAAIGFWLGRASQTPPAPIVRPIALWDLENMHNSEFIDVIQTTVLVLIAGILIYVVVRLDKAVTIAAKRLKTMVVKQQGLEEGIERIWKRIDLVESLQQGAQRPELRATLDEIRRRLDALEAKNETPPNNH